MHSCSKIYLQARSAWQKPQPVQRKRRRSIEQDAEAVLLGRKPCSDEDMEDILAAQLFSDEERPKAESARYDNATTLAEGCQDEDLEDLFAAQLVSDEEDAEANEAASISIDEPDTQCSLFVSSIERFVLVPTGYSREDRHTRPSSSRPVVILDVDAEMPASDVARGVRRELQRLQANRKETVRVLNEVKLLRMYATAEQHRCCEYTPLDTDTPHLRFH